jgi:hypothetical protein
MRKSRLKSSIVTATSLAAISIPHQSEAAATVTFSEDLLRGLSDTNNLTPSLEVSVLDFKNLTPDIVDRLGDTLIDLRGFKDARKIIIPWFASKLNIALPEDFGTPKNDSYGKIKIIAAGTSPTKDQDLTLDLSHLLQETNKVIVDAEDVPVTTLNAGSAAQVVRNDATKTLVVSPSVEAIGNIEGTTIKLSSNTKSTSSSPYRPSLAGLPSALIGTQIKTLDVSEFTVRGQELNVVDMPNLEEIITASTDTISSLRSSGEKEIAVTAPIQKLVITSSTPDQAVVDKMIEKTTLVAPLSKKSHIDSFIGKTALDFSNLELSTTDITADRIIEIFTDAVPITTIESMKIGSDVLNAVMTKMSLANLSGFSALKRLEVISPTKAYQTTSLVASQLPADLEEFYSSNLVVRKGTLTADLSIDKKYSANELDFSGLDLNGHALSIADNFSATTVSALKLNPSLLGVAAISNLMTSGSSKSIAVSGTSTGIINISNLENVGTINLAAVTGATSLSAAFNIDGAHTNLTQLHLPAGFDLTAANILSGVDNGEVTAHISGAYAGAITLDASYNNTILNFSTVTGTGRFRIPAGIRGLILADAVKGINVGAVANINEFNLIGLTYLRQLSGLSSTTTLLTLNNLLASTALELNLSNLSDIITLQLNSSKISKLTLPNTATLTNGGADEHLDMSDITSLAELTGLNELLAQGSLTQVSFPEAPATTLHVNLSETIAGVDFVNLDRIPQLTVDDTYAPSDMWPTVIDKTKSHDWGQFFNYLLAPVAEGGINSPTVFDLSGQMVETQAEVTALVDALNHNLPTVRKNALQKLIVRFTPTSTVNLDFSALDTTEFSHVSLRIISDQSTGSISNLTYPVDWNLKTRYYIPLDLVDKESSVSWSWYLNYRFALTGDKGEGATNLDLSSLELSATEWAALMTALDDFSMLDSIQTINIKLAADAAAAAPAFTTSVFDNLTSVIIDITGVKNAGSQISVTGLPAATLTLSVEQRINSASEVDRSTSSSWQGYIEHLLRNVSGTEYVLDLTAANLQLQSAAELTQLNTALAELSAANKAKIANIKLKLAAGNYGDFNLNTDLTGFANIDSFTVDATGTLNGTDQSAITFALTNAPAYVAAHVTNLASVDLDSQNSWDYYLAYRLATDGVGLTNLDLSAIQFSQQADLTAFLTSLHGQSGGNKATVQSINFKLSPTYVEDTFDLGADIGAGAEASGFTHGSFAVTVDRNGANITNPVNIDFGITVAAGTIRATNSIIVDTSFSSLATFDATNAHHWLGYIRTLLGAIAPAATTTLDLTTHSNLEMNNAKSAAFIVAMNALPDVDKAKVATLKTKLASGDFGVATADFSGLTGFTLTDLVVDRNGARSSANLYDPSVTVAGPGTITVNDLELRTITTKTSMNEWLSYVRFVLNGMVGTTNTIDLTAFAITSANEASAFNNAIQALPSAEKLKIQTLKLSVSSAETLGTGVSGLTNLTRVIVDQTSAPTDVVSLAVATVATGEFADAATSKFYVTSATVARDNNEWSKYIDYVMSSVANGGLALTNFDLSSITLTSTQIAQFLTAVDNDANVASVTDMTLKLASTFGAASIDLSAYSNLAGLVDNQVILYRNSASTDGAASSHPVAITFGGSFTNAKVQIVDDELVSVTDTAHPQKWLGYLTKTLNAGSAGMTLDLSSIAIDDAAAVTAFNTAINQVDSALAAKVATLKLNVTHAADITLGTGTTSFTNLTRIELTSKPVGNSITLDGDFSGKRTYLTDFASVLMDDVNDWTNYLNYMLSTTNGGQSATSLNLNSRAFLGQTELDAFFAGLDLLDGNGIYGDKSALTTLRITLDDGLDALSIGRINNTPTAASLLADGLRVIVNPGTSTNTTFAGVGAGEVEADNLIVLNSTPAVSKDHIAFLAEQNGFSGTIDLSNLTLASQVAVDALFTDLNNLSNDIKAKIKVLNIKLASGNYGQSSVTLNALTGFTGLTINLDRNGALDGVNTYNALVILTNNSGHTANLTDTEFHNMATFDNEDSSHWIGYLTHELNSAPAGYTLDVSTNSALTLDSANSFAAFSSALRYLSDNLKTKVALLKVKASTSGDFGATDWNGPGATERVIPDYAAFDNLAKVIIDYTATGLNVGAYIGDLDGTEKYAYISNPFNGMVNTDWERYFNYLLNDAADGGLGTTNIAINQRLSAAELAALLTGLDNATNKAVLANLTLNLASDVSVNISMGATALTGLSSVVINANGSTAKLIPTGSFIGKTSFLNASNINPTSSDSWAAYLAGQSSLAAIDIREVELANQAELTAFLTALNAATNKADVASIKLKLASGYSDVTVDFSTVAVADLTSLSAANSVEIHRNGNTATAVQGGDISDAKIKLVDLTATSLTDRSSAESWRRYLTQAIEDGGFAGTLDLASDSDTYLRTNAHLTAFMTALQSLSPANKALISDISIKLATSATWSNITNLGQGFSGFDALTAFTIDATGAYVAGGAQATIAFHADLGGVSTQAIVTSLSAVDRDNSNSWIYYIQGLLKDQVAADYDLDLTSSSLSEAEFPELMTALIGISNGGASNARDKIQKIRLKLAEGAWASNLTDVGMSWNGFMGNIDTFTIDATGVTVGGSQLTVGFSADLTDVSETTRAFVSSLDAVDKDNTTSWAYYLDHLTRNGAAALDLSSITLNVTELNALHTALNTFANTFGNGDLLSSIHIKVSGAAGSSNISLSANLDLQTGIDSAEKFIVDVTGFEHNGTQATVNHTGGTPKAVQLRVSNIANIYRQSATSWSSYFTHAYPTGIPATTTIDLTGSTSTYLRNQADVTALLTALNTHPDRGNISQLNVRLAPGNFGSDVVFNAGWNPNMTIIATGARNENDLLDFEDIHFLGSFTAAGKTFTQDFAIDVADLSENADWTAYLTTLITPISEGGFGTTALDISNAMLPDAAALSAFAAGLEALSDTLKDLVTHIYVNLSDIAGAIELGTGVSGFSNLAEVTYTREDPMGPLPMMDIDDATAANGSAFDGKIQRLRPLWNNHSVASATTMKEHLLYLLMDTSRGGSEETVLNLTGQKLANDTTAGYLNTALDNLPGDLKVRLTELRLNLDAAVTNAATFDAAGLTNLAAVKFTQGGGDDGSPSPDNAPTWTDVGGVGFGSATKTRFRATVADIANKESPAQWGEYFAYHLFPSNQGGLDETTIDVSSVDLGNDQVTWFFGGLREASLNPYRANITSIKFSVDNTGGDRTFDGGGLTYNDSLKIIAIMDNKPTSTFTLDTNAQGFKNSLTNDLPDSIIDHRITSPASVSRSSATSWGYWLNHHLGAEEETTIDLSGVSLTVTEAANFFDAVAAFTGDPTALTSIVVKLATVAGTDTLTISQDLSAYTALTSIIVDATGALDAGNQVIVAFGGNPGITTKEARVTDLTSVVLDSSTSWGYYLNYLAAQPGGITSIDLAAQDLADTDTGSTQPYLNAFFAALEARGDKNTVKDIFFNISGVNALTINIGVGTSNLDALQSIVIRRNILGGSTFTAAGDVSPTDIAVINNNAGLGPAGTVDQWKGYLAYLLENDDHKGAGYMGDPTGTVVYDSVEEDPITLNLSLSPLRIVDTTVFNALETAIAELPARLKARISGILIKTMDDNTDLSSIAFGTALDGKLTDFTALRAVIIDASATTTGGKKPAFAGVGDLFDASTISKIVY